MCEIAELAWEGTRDLGILKGPVSCVTPEVCKYSSLRFDKGSSWHLELK